MIELLPISIGVGLAISLLFTEFFGIAAAGMVVPGYVALHLSHPMAVALTLAAGLVTYAIVHALSAVVIIYGRRLTAITIVIGYVVGELFRWLGSQTAGLYDDFAVIGFIIPGLIAIWILRQGIIETASAIVTVSVVVRLVLVLAGLELAA